MLKGRAIPISLWILIGSIIGGLLLLALIIFILWKVFSCYTFFHISSGKWMCCGQNINLYISILLSSDSSHANREERMRTMRTEPNFCCHDNSHLPWRLPRELSSPLTRHRDSPGTGLNIETQQGPLGPKRASRQSTRNALPTISRVGSTYVNNLFLILRKKPKCIKPQFFYLIYRHLHGFTFQTITLSCLSYSFVFVL